VARVEVYEGAIAELAHEPAGQVAQAVERAAYLVENEAKIRILRPGSGFLYEPGDYLLLRAGKWYKWERTLPAHRASSPGDSPSSDTGLLLSTISHQVDEDENGIFYRVGSAQEDSLWLELGTKNMAPRPFLRPSLDVLGTVKIVQTADEIEPQASGVLWFTPLDGTEPTVHLGRGLQ
jgi:hypothetical protein